MKPLLFALLFSPLLNATELKNRQAHFYKNLRPLSSQRIVSLAPVATEIITALGLSDRLVGITRFCKKPSTKTIALIGGYIDPQLEAIIALKPDLVIAMPSMGVQKIVDQLHKKAIPTLIGFGDTLAEIRNLIDFIGTSTKKSAEAQRALQRFDLTLSKLRPLKATTPKRSVLVVVGNNPIVVAGHNTFIDEIIALMGFKSAVPAESLPWPTWSLEAVLAHSPEIIVNIQGPEALAQLTKDLQPILAHPKIRQTKIIAPPHPLLQSAGISLADEALLLKNLIEQAL